MRSNTILLTCLALIISSFFSCKEKVPGVKGKSGNEAVKVAKIIFGKDAVPDMYRYITGEYDGTPNGRDFANGQLHWRVLDQRDTIALINLTVIDSTGKGADLYLRMVKDTTWKLQSVRSLAMTGIMQAELEELEQMPQGYLDTLIAAAQADKQGNALKMLTSMDDYHFLIGNLRLALALDDTIADHFKRNKAAFNRLKDTAMAEMQRHPKQKEKYHKLLRKYSTDYKNLLIETVLTGEPEGSTAIRFMIGGMIDNFVGYLYVPDKKELPDLYESDLIMLRDLGDGWYIYKTT
ncbi:hypothetical protein SAMN05444266_11131 [Chitinophaga jiangningensis]|uniref:Uncharacterized protein n=1 Tax=Chitinophaga jiangningensis TaxID=1419482 RepID=A0A1M7LLS6_9BACT|nr:hypothetical protein [Chitinophaga jiangningensis]SHM78979.1 hypothetical protein SAMN05444266_11131 [Chitinophaga jiangningensis]